MGILRVQTDLDFLKLIDPTIEYLDGGVDSALIIKHTQQIPSQFLDKLKDAKLATNNRPMGDFHRFASIPTTVVEKWKREGFDVIRASAREIIRKLQSENLEAFITTNKVI